MVEKTEWLQRVSISGEPNHYDRLVTLFAKLIA